MLTTLRRVVLSLPDHDSRTVPEMGFTPWNVLRKDTGGERRGWNPKRKQGTFWHSGWE